MSKRKIPGISMRRPITEAEERVLKAASDWRYFTSVKVLGKWYDTKDRLYRAVEAYEKEAKR